MCAFTNLCRLTIKVLQHFVQNVAKLRMAESDKQTQWFVLRDLKRPNAKLPAYKFLRNERFEVFVPMKTRVITRQGKKEIEEIPVIQDLLFVHADRESLDPLISKTETLQYRFICPGKS